MNILLYTQKIIFMIFSPQPFFPLLPPININSFFLILTDIKLSFNSSRAIGPNSIPTRILKLLINDVSCQLTELFNLSFSSGVFSLIVKTSKVIPIYKKD